MRIGFTVVAIAAALPAVLAIYWDSNSCTYEGPKQKTICDGAKTAILYCNADGAWHNGHTCNDGCCRISPPPFHGQAGNAYCAC
ncbi:hypothetical protein BBO_00107 [Beauveria brongniartii RCEF 3172]|uniref:Uncharacterized protein n=1 Tax=Beauveria brongniartii RCEF 3172 TaxID=1081107 RepID=A0A167KVV2_9HYPO|nr:hypothetical protein BBO_00107 [Beauveria brongniartii RCEF 3172]